MNAKAAVLCVVVPAGAMGAGALLQQLLLSLWPTIQTVSLGGVSLDTYLSDAAIVLLCFLAGLVIKRSAPARGVLMASFTFPLLWLIALLLMVVTPNQMSDAVKISFVAAAVAPTLALGLAYSLPSNKRLSGRET